LIEDGPAAAGRSPAAGLSALPLPSVPHPSLEALPLPFSRSSKLKISCPSCEAKYSIGDEKVHDRLAKIRCRKCGADIVIDGRVTPPSVSLGDAAITTGEHPAAAPAAAHGSPKTSTEYTVDLGENDQRAMSVADLVEAYNAGLVTGETYLWSDGMTDWTPLAQVAEVVEALNVAASQPEASSAPAAAAPSRGLSSPAAAVRTASVGPRATDGARVSGTGRADLFGSIAHAGSEEDVTTSAPQEPLAPAAATGARNESSVLFSLSALTASAKSTPAASAPLPTAARAKDEDSDLIDLKALTSQASTTAAAAPAAPAAEDGLVTLGEFGGIQAPLGAGLGGGGLGSPLGGLGSPLAVGGGLSVGAGDVHYPQQKSRTGLYIGGGIAVGLIALALVIGLRSDPAPVAAPAPAPTPTPYRPPEDDAPSKEASLAKPPPTGAEETSAAPSASTAPKTTQVAKGGGGRRTTGGKTGGTTGASGGSTPPAAATPKKPSSPCGCAPSDLNCVMRCSVKSK